MAVDMYAAIALNQKMLKLIRLSLENAILTLFRIKLVDNSSSPKFAFYCHNLHSVILYDF